MTRDPQRLLDDPTVPASLRGAVGEARGQGPSSAERLAIAAGLGPLAHQPIALPPTKAGGVGLGAKLGLTLVGVALLLGAGVLASERAVPPSSGALRAGLGSAGASAARPAAAPLVGETQLDPPAPAIDLDADAAAEPPRAAPPPASATAGGPSEVTLLDQARQSLSTNPARALALTEEHRRRFPRGALAQEREVIAIDALGRLGRGGEADRRSKAFGAQNPGTIHRRTVTEVK